MSSPGAQIVFSRDSSPPTKKEEEEEFLGEMAAFRIRTQSTRQEPGVACLSDSKKAINDNWVKSKGQRSQHKVATLTKSWPISTTKRVRSTIDWKHKSFLKHKVHNDIHYPHFPPKGS